MCVCVMGDAGAPWADITQDALGGGGHRGYRAGRSLSVELANTPVIALQARPPPPRPRLQHVNTHSDKQANTRSGSTFRATERLC